MTTYCLSFAPTNVSACGMALLYIVSRRKGSVLLLLNNFLWYKFYHSNLLFDIICLPWLTTEWYYANWGFCSCFPNISKCSSLLPFLSPRILGCMLAVSVQISHLLGTKPDGEFFTPYSSKYMKLADDIFFYYSSIYILSFYYSCSSSKGRGEGSVFFTTECISLSKEVVEAKISYATLSDGAVDKHLILLIPSVNHFLLIKQEKQSRSQCFKSIVYRAKNKICRYFSIFIPLF